MEGSVVRVANDETFLEWIAARGGVAHSAEVRARGYSQRAIVQATADDAVQRVRRSWFVTPDTPAGLVAAVSAGGRLSCVSAAQKRGLWVPEHSGVHISVKPTASRLSIGESEDMTVHWAVAPVVVARYAVEDPLVNVLFRVARCLPREQALAVWESAIRKRLVSLEVLLNVEWASARVAEIARAASALSDSGLETFFLVRMRQFPLSIRQQVRIDGHRVDFLIGERLVVEIDGFSHHSESHVRRRDIRQDARLALRGYTVLRFDWKQILFDWDVVEATVLTAVAQGLHVAPAQDTLARR